MHNATSLSFATVFLSLTLILHPTTGFGGVIALPYELTANAQATSAGYGTGDFDSSNNPATATASMSTNGVDSFAEVVSEFGTLRANASITKAEEHNFNFALGIAKFRDTLTITGGSGAGTVSLGVLLTGTLTDIAAGEQRSSVELNIFRPGSFDGASELFQVESGTQRTLNEMVIASDLPFTFGTPFEIEVTLTADVSLEFNDIGTAQANAGNTATLSQITVTGATGPVLITGASGAVYVPEPGTCLLLALGLVSMAVARRRL